MIYALMKILTSNRTPRQMAEDKGVKLYDTIWINRGSKERELSIF